MFIESLDDYLDTLAGYIYDDDKLVTYKWLSKQLEVHVNVAKQILWEFTQRHKEEETLECTYLLIGTLSDGGMRVEVAKASDLVAVKKKYNKIISEHIYSLQKTLPDIELLAIAGDGDVKYSAIRCKESVERSNEEMHMLRWSTLKYDPEQAKPLEKQETATVDVSKTKSLSPIRNEFNSEKKAMPTKKNTTLNQKNGFNNLFGKANSKQKSPPSSSVITKKTNLASSKKDTSPKTNKSSSPKEKVLKKGGLDTFVAKGNTQVANTVVSTHVTENDKASEDLVMKDHVKQVSILPAKKKQKKDTRGKKRNRSKEVNVEAQKRKRIMICDSSSDSESISGDEEPEPEPSPKKVMVERSPSPPKFKQEGGKRKVLKMVDKTFEEDGFLVTKKVHVYESCSEEEPDNVEIKKIQKLEPQSDICEACLCSIKDEGPTINCDDKELGNNDVLNFELLTLDESKMPSTLILSRNRITEIPRHTLRKFKRLKSLDLSQNYIKEINAGMYADLTNLEDLNFSNNSIELFDISVISVTPTVTILNLSHNLIANLENTNQNFPNVTLHQLRVLDLSYNNLTNIPNSMSTINFPELRTLIVNGNSLKNIMFPDKLILHTLTASNIKSLKSINENVFSKLEAPQGECIDLVVSNNEQLTLIHAEAFQHLNICHLDLSNNHITQVSSQLISDDDNLSERFLINLQGNPFECNCSLQWMLDDIVPWLYHTDPTLLENLRCASPPKMASVRMVHWYKWNEKVFCKDAGDFSEKLTVEVASILNRKEVTFESSPGLLAAIGTAITLLTILVIVGIILTRRRYMKKRRLNRRF
ncbi:hypothetical protein KM043_010773 [Ampulex compressa]|nr:hypothetical protein KM043_010773 [Ampulex compressa]